MATTKQAMTPQDAIATLREVGQYRERLTARAAALLWVVWGLVLGVVGFGVLAETLARVGRDWWWYEAILVPFCFGVGALASNLVWRAHALERDPGHRPWVAWAAAFGALAAMSGVTFLLRILVYVHRSGDPAFNLAPLLLAGAIGAVLLAVTARRRAPLLPGLVAAGALAVAFAVLAFGPWSYSPTLELAGNMGLVLGLVATYVGVGAWLFRQG